MKTSTLSSIAMVSILAVSSVAFAQGRGGASAGASAQGGAGSAATQTRVHTPGTGLLPGATPLQTRIHTPGTGLPTATATPGAGQGGAVNGGRGIHTPGTGLVTPAPVPAPVSN